MSIRDPQPDDYSALRAHMVSKQLEAQGVDDARILAAMRQVPRHEFVPRGLQQLAYDDRPLSIGRGQTISQPYMVAVMTAALCPVPTDLVLEVGTGSGYQAAILAMLAREVVSIESVPELADGARATLARLGISSVTVIEGDGSAGFPERQPYDGIMVTAGAPGVPEPLRQQLVDGGRFVVPVGTTSYQQVVVIQRHGGRFDEEVREGCVFVPLKGTHGWK